MIAEVVVEAVNLSIPLDTALIRGYNISVEFNITLRNTNDTIDIVQLSDDEKNFNISLWLASGDLEADGMIATTKVSTYTLPALSCMYYLQPKMLH